MLLNWYFLAVFDRDYFNRELFTVYEIIKRAKSSNSGGFMKFWKSYSKFVYIASQATRVRKL